VERPEGRPEGESQDRLEITKSECVLPTSSLALVYDRMLTYNSHIRTMVLSTRFAMSRKFLTQDRASLSAAVLLFVPITVNLYCYILVIPDILSGDKDWIWILLVTLYNGPMCL
jgi:hypothetical protein